MSAFSCSLCGEEIYEDDRRTMMKQVIGWAKPARGKLAASIVDRRDTGAVAHADCVERKRRGIPPKQQGLF